MNWLLLIIAGLFEVGFATCLGKARATTGNTSVITQLSDWKFSSYLDYSGKRSGTLCNKNLLFEYTGLTVPDIINRSETIIDPKILSKLE